MIRRSGETKAVASLLARNPVVAILGARQVGKTTLARQVLGAGRRRSSWFDLENPVDEGRLADPMMTLASARGIVVLDEVQRRPDLFPALRVLADRLEHGEAVPQDLLNVSFVAA